MTIAKSVVTGTVFRAPEKRFTQNNVKGDKILVEGRLQTANAKMEDGSERKIFEIDANAIEKMGAVSSSSSPAQSSGEISKFAEEEFSEELIGEEEIPF